MPRNRPQRSRRPFLGWSYHHDPESEWNEYNTKNGTHQQPQPATDDFQLITRPETDVPTEDNVEEEEYTDVQRGDNVEENDQEEEYEYDQVDPDASYEEETESEPDSDDEVDDVAAAGEPPQEVKDAYAHLDQLQDRAPIDPQLLKIIDLLCQGLAGVSFTQKRAENRRKVFKLKLRETLHDQYRQLETRIDEKLRETLHYQETLHDQYRQLETRIDEKLRETLHDQYRQLETRIDEESDVQISDTKAIYEHIDHIEKKTAQTLSILIKEMEDEIELLRIEIKKQQTRKLPPPPVGKAPSPPQAQAEPTPPTQPPVPKTKRSWLWPIGAEARWNPSDDSIQHPLTANAAPYLSTRTRKRNTPRVRRLRTDEYELY